MYLTQDNNHMPFSAGEPWLAPLAGFSNLPFRLLCREQGAAAACTEMVSAKGLVYGGKGAEHLLQTCPEDAPLAVQLFGSEEQMIQRAAGILLERGFANLDLNAGCSVRKVVKTGAGAALMSDPAKLASLAAAMVRLAGPGRVGVKMRLGPKSGEDTYLECAGRLCDAGVAWLTLHPRYANQGFAGRAGRDALAELARTAEVPVIASGDLFTAEDAADRVRETGAAGVMFARGALNYPGVFMRYREILAGRTPKERTPPEIYALLSRHAELARIHAYDGRKELMKMRTIAPRYVKGLPGASRLRNALVKVSSWEELARLSKVLETAN